MKRKRKHITSQENKVHLIYTYQSADGNKYIAAAVLLVQREQTLAPSLHRGIRLFISNHHLEAFVVNNSGWSQGARTQKTDSRAIFPRNFVPEHAQETARDGFSIRPQHG